MSKRTTSHPAGRCCCSNQLIEACTHRRPTSHVRSAHGSHSRPLEDEVRSILQRRWQGERARGVDIDPRPEQELEGESATSVHFNASADPPPPPSAVCMRACSPLLACGQLRPPVVHDEVGECDHEVDAATTSTMKKLKKEEGRRDGGRGDARRGWCALALA